MVANPAAMSVPDPENEPDRQAGQLIGHKEEDCRHNDHDEDHAGGDRGFAPRRPGDLLGLRLRHDLSLEPSCPEALLKPFPSWSLPLLPVLPVAARLPDSCDLAGVEGLEPP